MLPNMDPHKVRRFKSILQLASDVELRDDLSGSLSYVGQKCEVKLYHLAIRVTHNKLNIIVRASVFSIQELRDNISGNTCDSQ